MTGREKYLFEKLKLEIHPEGGMFRETYRSGEFIPREALPGRYSGRRTFSTSIYYLVPEGVKSKFHRLKTDEVWHFYEGSRLSMHVIYPDGDYRKIYLGNNPENDEHFQLMIPMGAWFGAIAENGYTLAGCTTAPGFEFDDMEMAGRDDLIKKYPNLKGIIELLT